jgi:hypothetical protein
MANLFYLVDMVVNVVALVVCLWRWRQTMVNQYALLSAAILCEAIADLLFAFFSSPGGLTPAIVYVGLVLVMTAFLLLNLIVVGLFNKWLHSLPQAPYRSIARLLYAVYPIVALCVPVAYVLLSVNLTAAVVFGGVATIAYAVGIVCQLVVLSVASFGKSTSHLVQKRTQVRRLLALTVVGILPYLFALLGTGYVFMACWWLWYIIALLPHAFVGYELEDHHHEMQQLKP